MSCPSALPYHAVLTDGWYLLGEPVDEGGPYRAGLLGAPGRATSHLSSIPPAIGGSVAGRPWAGAPGWKPYLSRSPVHSTAAASISSHSPGCSFFVVTRIGVGSQA